MGKHHHGKETLLAKLVLLSIYANNSCKYQEIGNRK